LHSFPPYAVCQVPLFFLSPDTPLLFFLQQFFFVVPPPFRPNGPFCPRLRASTVFLVDLSPFFFWGNFCTGDGLAVRVFFPSRAPLMKHQTSARTSFVTQETGHSHTSSPPFESLFTLFLFSGAVSLHVLLPAMAARDSCPAPGSSMAPFTHLLPPFT